MVIKIVDHVGRCYSNQDGLIVKMILLKHLNSNKLVILSFEGIDGVTSSFVNTALIELLEDFDFDKIKQNLKFTNTNRQINEMIKNRFKFEINRKKNLVNCS
ncbi:STAS-like domain-containing protein [Metabacillus herbersteinensis]|uniref:STAS-like domain-containing protein n=1 Tax=Metabacillus herbersteinensis TaxID=283816 RepID=A0ABV6GBV6_9BACI